jgi:hypothetical protein
MSITRLNVAVGLLAILVVGLGVESAQAALPTDGLKLWLNADSITGVANGQKVSVWNDSSGNGLNLSQSDTNSRPVFVSNAVNGQPAVQFSAGAYLKCVNVVGSSLTSTNQATVFGVVMQPQGSNPTTALFCWASGPMDNRFMLYATYNNQITFADGNRTGGVDFLHWTQPQGWNDQYHLLNVLRSGQTFGCIVDGTDQGIPTSGLLTDNLDPFDVTQTADLNLGRDLWGIGDRYGGNLAELIVYDRALSAAETDTVNGYLSSKYGIAPEPASVTLLALGGLALLRRKRENRHTATLPA